MEAKDFGPLAELMSQILLRGRSVADEVTRFRKGFTEMRYCLSGEESSALIQKLLDAI
jgi:hypothetical protein